MGNSERIRRTDGEWEELIKEFNASGLTQGVFCEQRGVNFHSFRRRYRRSPQFSGKGRKSSLKSFSELTTLMPPSSGGLVVWLGETVRIECPSGMSLEAVAKMARGLAHDG
jgi:hypothetical protein